MDEVKYDPTYDYSFLSICKLGKYPVNFEIPKNGVIWSNSQAKGSVNRNRARADLLTCPGPNVSEPLRSTSLVIEREQLELNQRR